MNAPPEQQIVSDAILSSRNQDTFWLQDRRGSLGVISSLNTSTFRILVTGLFKAFVFCSYYFNLTGILHLSFLHLLFVSYFLFNPYLQNTPELITVLQA